MRRTILLILVIAPGLVATIINVPADYASIQGGLDGANEGDTVSVSTGVYFENIIWPATYGINLIGSGPETCIIDGDSLGSVIRFELESSSFIDSMTLISGFRVQYGYAHGLDSQSKGGGIYSNYSRGQIFHNLQIMNNSSEGDGGGIWNAPVLGHVIVDNNHSNGSGGGICYFERIRYSVVTNNTSAYDGGGVKAQENSKYILNTTIVNNSSAFGAGGYSIGEMPFEHYPTLVINSIIWANNPTLIDQGMGMWSPDSHFIYSLIEDWGWGDEYNMLDVDPSFVNPPLQDFHLQSNSPCINSGIAFYILEGDTIVNLSSVEYSGSAPDMGAFESPYLVSTNRTSIKPDNITIYQNYPNPFNPTTTIEYSLPEAGSINLTVFDIRGKEVTTLHDVNKPPGSYEVLWNGMDQHGNPVSTGVYFARLQAGDFSQTIKMVYLR